MALNKIALQDKKNKIIAIVMAGLILAGGIGAVNIKNNQIDKLNEELSKLKKENKEVSTIMNTLMDDNNSMMNQISKSIESDAQQKKLIEKVKNVVSDRNFEIQDMDVIRALNSAENRLSDEYIRIAALVLATMETESGFKHIINTNSNGTKDHGIMQVNEVTLPQLKETLGDDFDPINNKNDNVEAGAYFIYDCYLKAKDKHPEDVIWWTYAYYNRGQYFEGTDAWKNPSNPSYKRVHDQANKRSKIFREKYDAYHKALSE